MGDLLEKIENKTAIIAIIGLGYTGLSLAHEFGLQGFKVIGFDINKENDFPLPKIEKLVREKRLVPTKNLEDLNDADIKIICVPTPLNAQQQPDISYLKKAVDTAAKTLQKKQLIVIQSTTFPGTTDDLALPMIEKSAKLKVGKDFYLAYVPEREDTDDSHAILSQIPRLCGGLTPKCTKLACALYEKITLQVNPCPSAKIAEAAKIFENTYKLINSAFVNEMQATFDQMKLNIWEVIEAASTQPLIDTPLCPGSGTGGDPIYLLNQAHESETPVSMIKTAIEINNQATQYVVKKIQDALDTEKQSIRGSKILILGIASKKDVADLREAPALKLIPMLEKMGAKVAYNDPFFPQIKQPNLISTPLSEMPKFDCVVIITDHSQYNWEKICDRAKCVVDMRNATAHLSSKHKKKVFL